MSQYRILTNQDEEYALADRCGRVVKALRELQVDTTFYTIQERYNFVKEMLWDDKWLTKEKEEGETVEYQLKPAKLNPYDFLEKASAVLFPDAKITEDHLDHEVARKALEDFTSRTDRKRPKLTDLFS